MPSYFCLLHYYPAEAVERSPRQAHSLAAALLRQRVQDQISEAATIRENPQLSWWGEQARELSLQAQCRPTSSCPLIAAPPPPQSVTLPHHLSGHFPLRRSR